jgi:hypothetical protein
LSAAEGENKRWNYHGEDMGRYIIITGYAEGEEVATPATHFTSVGRYTWQYGGLFCSDSQVSHLRGMGVEKSC